jgi:hypothetical protein
MRENCRKHDSPRKISFSVGTVCSVTDPRQPMYEHVTSALQKVNKRGPRKKTICRPCRGHRFVVGSARSIRKYRFELRSPSSHCKDERSSQELRRGHCEERQTGYVYLKSNIVWNVTPCSVVQVYRRFGDHTASIFRVEE